MNTNWLLKLFPGPVDNSNCGVFVVAQGEALSQSAPLASTDPTRLRLRYIQILVEPLQDELRRSECLCITRSAKRRKSAKEIDHADCKIKKMRHLPFSINPTRSAASEDSAVRRQFSGLGAPWVSYYDQLKTNGTLPYEAQMILACVACVACNETMHDLAWILRDTRELPSSQNLTEAALDLYTNAEANLIGSKLRMSYAAICIYRRFEQLTIAQQDLMKRRRQRRQVATRSGLKPNNACSKKKASSYVLDQITAEALGISVDELEQRKDCQICRERVRKIKDEGKVAHEFEQQCGEKLWILIPHRDTAAPFDQNFIVNSTRYICVNFQYKDRLC